jgi:signal transduction histidine kinase
MVAPLLGEHGVVGTIMVGDRLGDVSSFDTEDLKLFETLANHASVSLENAGLVDRLKESLAHLTEMNRLKDDFVAAVSHELRTPLTSIQGYVKTLLRPEVDFDPEQQRSFLEAVDRQSDRLRNLIEDLLAVSRLESEELRTASAIVSLPTLVERVVDELGERKASHPMSLDFEDELPVVVSDEGKIHQILLNLVDNAFKYAPEGTEVTVSGRREAEGVVLSVSDLGEGVPTDVQERIFDRFYQVDQSSTRKVGGTGLGLYICRRLGEAIGGRVWLERSTPEGSTFSLWIPLAPPNLVPLEQPRSIDARLEP